MFTLVNAFLRIVFTTLLQVLNFKTMSQNSAGVKFFSTILFVV